jgi:hypothetical protein
LREVRLQILPNLFHTCTKRKIALRQHLTNTALLFPATMRQPIPALNRGERVPKFTTLPVVEFRAFIMRDEPRRLTLGTSWKSGFWD